MSSQNASSDFPQHKDFYRRNVGARFQSAIEKSEGKQSHTLKEDRWRQKIDLEMPSLSSKLLANKYFQAVLIYVTSMILLYLLSPPIVCNRGEQDALDAYKCNVYKVMIVATIGPAAFLVIPIFFE